MAALVLSLAGDVFLMLPQDLFVFGLASFLLGHIAYIVGMHVDGVDGPRFLVGIVIVMALLAVIGTRILRGVRAGPDPALAGPGGRLHVRDLGDGRQRHRRRPPGGGGRRRRSST